MADFETMELGSLSVHRLGFETMQLTGPGVWGPPRCEGISPRIVTDLPAGGRRLLQSATGYRYTVKSGEVMFEDDVATGQLPGKLLPGAQG
jgi:N-acyl-D-aspartate/D-glutamate deacylase